MKIRTCSRCSVNEACYRCMGAGVYHIAYVAHSCEVCRGTGLCAQCLEQPEEGSCIRPTNPEVRTSVRAAPPAVQRSEPAITPYGRVLPGRLASFEVCGIVAAVNSCPACDSSTVCVCCKGVGFIESRNAQGGVTKVKCGACNGSGVCDCCRAHLGALQKFLGELRVGYFGAAEAELQRALAQTTVDEQNAKSNWNIGALGAGVVIGSIIAPGFGTLIGAALGKALGERAGESAGPHAVRWRQADLFYSLGVLYTAQGRLGEASQAWVKALTLRESHTAARAALKASL